MSADFDAFLAALKVADTLREAGVSKVECEQTFFAEMIARGHGDRDREDLERAVRIVAKERGEVLSG